jgi:hypothetical protein
MSRAWIDAAAAAVTFTPSTATKLAPILVEEAPPDAGDEDAEVPPQVQYLGHACIQHTGR